MNFAATVALLLAGLSQDAPFEKPEAVTTTPAITRESTCIEADNPLELLQVRVMIARGYFESSEDFLYSVFELTEAKHLSLAEGEDNMLRGSRRVIYVRICRERNIPDPTRG